MKALTNRVAKIENQIQTKTMLRQVQNTVLCVNAVSFSLPHGVLNGISDEARTAELENTILAIDAGTYTPDTKPMPSGISHDERSALARQRIVSLMS